MSQSKSHNASQSFTKTKVITRPVLLLFVVFALAYYLILAAIYALFGERTAGWLANPLFGIAVFYITKWDGTKTQQYISWRDYIKFPQLKLKKLIIINLTIYVVQFIGGYIAGIYVTKTRPDLTTDTFLEGFTSTFDVWGGAIIMITGIVLSYFLGGYVAGKLSPYKYQAPYSHTAVGVFIYLLIGNVIIQILYVCECGTPPTLEDLGTFVVSIPPIMLLAIFGTRVATRIPLSHNKKYTESISSEPRHDIDLEPLATHTSPDQHAVTFAGSKSLKSQPFSRKEKRRKKRKRR
jgi:hypothetical protein